MPKDFRDAMPGSLFKNKGSKPDHVNYQDISLLSTARKIWAYVILNCLVMSISVVNLSGAQCGFHPDCSTIDMVFTVFQAQEKFTEQH